MDRARPLDAADLPAGLWHTAVKIRFGQCDPAGIVYTPHYFDLFNGVIEDWYPAALGLDYHAFLRDRRMGLGYATAACDFLAPSAMGDVLTVHVALRRLGGASFTLVLHALKEGREAVRGRFVVVTTDLGSRRPVPVPADLRAALAAYGTWAASD